MRYKALDGLRGIAALSVVLQHFTTDTNWHAAIFRDAGSVGVALFFVLSGFLMGRLYGATPFSAAAAGAFWVRRVARVVPLYLVCVIVAYGWLAIAGFNKPFFTVTWDWFWPHLLFWDAQSVMWAVPREVQFYATFPLVWWALQWNRGAAVLYLFVALCFLAAAQFQSPVVLFRSAHFFIAGILASLFPLQRSSAFDFPFVVLFGCLFASWPGVMDALGLPRVWLWGNPIYLFVLPALIVAAVHSPLAERVLGNRPVAYLGVISYSVYLLHAPVFWSLFLFTPMPDWPRSVFFLTSLAVVLAAASASYFLFEVPTRRWIGGLASPLRQAPPPLRPVIPAGS